MLEAVAADEPHQVPELRHVHDRIRMFARVRLILTSHMSALHTPLAIPQGARMMEPVAGVIGHVLQPAPAKAES